MDFKSIFNESATNSDFPPLKLMVIFKYFLRIKNGHQKLPLTKLLTVKKYLKNMQKRS